MNGAINESTFNFFFKLNYDKTFASILATPLSPGDIALGELGWALIRGGLYAVGFMAVMVVLGLVVSPWVVLAVPAALLIGFAFGGGRHGRDLVHEDVAGLRPDPAGHPADVPVLRDVLPGRRATRTALRFVVQLTPLYQGVDLIRSLTVGAISPILLVHVAYLTVMGVVGLAVDLAAARQAAAQVGSGGA